MIRSVLVQVLGHKYIRLYDAAHTHRLYPRSGAFCNNCHASVDAPDGEAHPRFTEAPFAQGILAPGEARYLPRHAWHYVRSLEPSFSVSFWWGARMGLVSKDDGAVEAVY